MKLSIFNGGLNTRHAPELIKPNEAQVCHNVQVQSGQLANTKGLGSFSTTSSVKPHYFVAEDLWLANAATRNYLEYQGKMYWTDGVQPRKLALGVEQNLGITQPGSLTVTTRAIAKPTSISVALVAAPIQNGVPAGITGTYTYAYTYYNPVSKAESLPIESVPIAPANKGVNVTITASVDTNVANIRVYRKGGAHKGYRLFATFPNTGLTTLDNTPDSTLVNASVMPAVNNTVVQYLYTYYNITDGTESAPSGLSPELPRDVTTLDFTIPVVASLDPQVTHIRVYRIGGALLGFTRLVELPNTTVTYVDTAVDSSLVVQLLTAKLNNPPPVGLKYLTYSGGLFFGAVGSKLYFSRDIGNPNYWPATSYIDFRTPITALAATSAGLIVFSQYQTHLVTGTNAANLVNYLLSGDQGCVEHNSIANTKSGILFISTDGICSLVNTQVTVVSKFKLGKQTYVPTNAVMFDEEYFCLLTDGTIIALDMRYEPLLETYDFQLNWLAKANDILYGATPTGLFEMFAGADVPYHYTTGELTEQRVSELKTYDHVYFYVVGTHDVKVFINNVLVATKTIVGAVKPQRLAIPQALQRGSSIKFELTGIGIVKEIEYIAVGRENA